MSTTGTQRNKFSPKIDILGNPINVCCLSPVWMCWMPWLADGEEIKPFTKKTIERNRTRRNHMAGLKGLQTAPKRSQEAMIMRKTGAKEKVKFAKEAGRNWDDPMSTPIDTMYVPPAP